MPNELYDALYSVDYSGPILITRHKFFTDVFPLGIVFWFEVGRMRDGRNTLDIHYKLVDSSYRYAKFAATYHVFGYCVWERDHSVCDFYPAQTSDFGLDRYMLSKDELLSHINNCLSKYLTDSDRWVEIDF
jgi:hypothetical protein